MDFAAKSRDHEVACSAEKARETLKSTKAVLLDWDGCIAFGNQPTPDAVRFIQENLHRVAIVSNNSTNRPEDFAEILARSGVELPSERIILAGVETLIRARELAPDRVLLLADSRMKALGRGLGLNIAKDNADLVLLLRDTRISYFRIEQAANCLHKGAKLIVSNPDANHQGSRGKVIPETGALLAALQVCVGDSDFETEIVGKPGHRLFDRACLTLNVSPGEAVMIGDNPATDAAGAKIVGMDYILIGPASGLEFTDLMEVQPDRRRRHAGAARTG